MVASAFTALAATTAPKVSAATGTVTTLSVSPTKLNIGQTYTLSGTLKKSSGTPLASKRVLIYHYYKGIRTNDFYVTTNAYGKFSKLGPSLKTCGVRTWYARYASSSTYRGSTSAGKTNSVKTGTTLTATAPASVSPDQTFIVYGYLKNQYGKAMAHQPVKLYFANSGTGWFQLQTVYTDANGRWFRYESDTNPVHYKAVYDESTCQWGATTYTGWVSIGSKIGTTLTAKASVDHASANQEFAIDGYLKTLSGIAIANQPVKLYYAYNDAYGWRSMFGGTPVYTDAKGHWSTTHSDTENIHYKAVYDGSTTYVGATAFSYWVGIKAGTTLTAKASVNHAAPNEAFTISGDLTTTVRHTPLGNQPVTLYYAFNDANPWRAWIPPRIVYTDANGHWSITDYDNQDIHYKAVYDGATWLDASTAYTGWVGIP
jgi:hypothetical protein